MSPHCTLFARQSAVLHYRARSYTTALEKIARARELGPPSRVSVKDWEIELRDLEFRIYLQQHDSTRARAAAVALAELHGATRIRVDAFISMPADDAIGSFLSVSATVVQPMVARGAASASRLALLNAMAGRTDQALDWLERAAAERDADFLFTLRDPALDRLRHLPRFRSLLPRALAQPAP